MEKSNNIVCRRCGLINDYYTLTSGPHLKAMCNGCDRYIKFISKQKTNQMAEKKLTGSIALTKLIHVMMEKKGKNGMVKGLFIPLEQNLLTEKDGAVYMPVNIVYKSEQDQYKQNGFIAKTTDSKIWKDLDDVGKENAKKLSPILGNIKDWSSLSADDNSGSASEQTLTEEDDLPF